MLVRRMTTSVAEGTSEASSGAGADANSARNKRLIGIWLATTAGAVFAMVVIGGVTRLTRSGLSIVEWSGVHKMETWPTDDAGWVVEFEKYKQYPEFYRANRHMTLEQFKDIYFWEWLHRQWGRAIGVMFAAPLAFFAATRRIPPGFGSKLGLLLGLGIGQGFIGWWMVKSGMEHERFNETTGRPRVSPYRMATHVSRAVVVWL